MEFKNVEKLEAELKKRLKVKCFNLQGYLNEVERRVSENDSTDLELSRFETKSGHTELIPFEVDRSNFIYDDDGDFLQGEEVVIF